MRICYGIIDSDFDPLFVFQYVKMLSNLACHDLSRVLDILLAVLTNTQSRRPRSNPGVSAPQLLDGHLLVGAQLVDLVLHRCRVFPGITLLCGDGGLVVLLAVAVEVAIDGLQCTDKVK